MIWRDDRGRFIKKDVSLLSEVEQRQREHFRLLGEEACRGSIVKQSKGRQEQFKQIHRDLRKAQEVNSLPISQQSEERKRNFIRFTEKRDKWWNTLTPEERSEFVRKCWQTRRERYVEAKIVAETLELLRNVEKG